MVESVTSFPFPDACWAAKASSFRSAPNARSAPKRRSGLENERRSRLFGGTSCRTPGGKPARATWSFVSCPAASQWAGTTAAAATRTSRLSKLSPPAGRLGALRKPIEPKDRTNGTFAARSQKEKCRHHCEPCLFARPAVFELANPCSEVGVERTNSLINQYLAQYY